MKVKQTLAAGLAALALVVAPVGLTAQWSDHGTSIVTTPAVSTAYAASKERTPTKPPADGGPAFTSSGTATKTTGWQTGLGPYSDMGCQQLADSYDDLMDKYAQAIRNGLFGRNTEAIRHQAEAQLSGGMDLGCAFTGPYLPS